MTSYMLANRTRGTGVFESCSQLTAHCKAPTSFRETGREGDRVESAKEKERDAGKNVRTG